MYWIEQGDLIAYDLNFSSVQKMNSLALISLVDSVFPSKGALSKSSVAI